MANSINATSTGNGGIITTGDDSGVLNIQTNETTAVSIDASQSVDFTNNIDAPNTFGFKNRLINGNMAIDQRNAGGNSTAINTYTVDRWGFQATQSNKGTWGQNFNAATPPSGFANYLGFQTGGSPFSVGAGDYFSFYQPIEGFNTADLAWGTASAKTVTLSFQVYSSLTGTFGGVLQNSASTRCYPFTYTVSSANTWTQISVTVAGETTGTWLTTNGVGVRVLFNLGCGTTYSGAAGAWSSNNYVAPTGTVSVVGTASATFYITGVQLEKGTQATSFDFRSYGTELALCQRYYSVLTDLWGDTGSTSGWRYMCRYSFPVTMRTTPTVTLNSVSVNQINTPQANRTNTDGTHLYATTTATTTDAYWIVGNMTMAAEL